MKFILKKMKNKKDRSAYFICSLSYKYPKKRDYCKWEDKWDDIKKYNWSKWFWL